MRRTSVTGLTSNVVSAGRLQKLREKKKRIMLPRKRLFLECVACSKMNSISEMSHTISKSWLRISAWLRRSVIVRRTGDTIKSLRIRRR